MSKRSKGPAINGEDQKKGRGKGQDHGYKGIGIREGKPTLAYQKLCPDHVLLQGNELY